MEVSSRPKIKGGQAPASNAKGPNAKASGGKGGGGKEASAKAPKERRIRGAIGRSFMKVPFLRRWYIRRILRFIDKSKEKGRRLPEGMAETARFLSRVPKDKRLEAFEEALLTSQEMPNMGRDYRRAASRQRKSGKSETNYRPGLPPGATREIRRKSR